MPQPIRLRLTALSLLALLVLAALPFGVARAQTAAPRIALVIGNAAYKAGALATPANDAGLIAQTLGQAGFDVVGARDLDQDSIRKAFRDFLDKAQAAGPDAIAFVYLSGYGVQYAGENYYVPVDASMPRAASVPIEAVRISDFTRALAATPLKARVVVLDLARANPFVRQGAPLAGGLAIVAPEPGTLYAFNAAPGTIGPNEPGPYGAYAQALAEMMHEGLPVNDVFSQARLRVNEVTQGLEVPWDASAITSPFVFFQRAADAAPLPVLSAAARAAATKPIRDFSPEQAYGIAVERDTMRAYEDFLAAYPHHPLARRVRALLAARREAITWERTVRANTPDAYWTYMRRYPKGPHVADARRRLERLSAALQPPPDFRYYDYEDLPPPPPDEVVIVDDRPYVYFDDDDYPPPPPPPAYLIDRPRHEFVELPPPPPPQRPGYLPIPVPVPMPWSHGFGRDHDREHDRRVQQGQAAPVIALPKGVKPAPTGAPPRFEGGPHIGKPGQGRPPQPVQAVPVKPGQPVQAVPVRPGQPVQAVPVKPGQPVQAVPVKPGQPVQAVPVKPALTAPTRPAAPVHALPVPAKPTAPPPGPVHALPVPAKPARPAPPVHALPVPAKPQAVVPAHPAGPSPAERARQLQIQQQRQQQQQRIQQMRQQQQQQERVRAEHLLQERQRMQQRPVQAPHPVQARPAPPPHPVQARPVQAPHPVQARPVQAPHPVQARPAPPSHPVQARPAPPHPQPAHPAPACGHPGQPPCR